MKFTVSLLCVALVVAQLAYLMVADVDALRSQLSLDGSHRSATVAREEDDVELTDARRGDDGALMSRFSAGRATTESADSSRLTGEMHFQEEADDEISKHVSQCSVRVLDGAFGTTKDSTRGMGIVLDVDVGTDSFDVLSADHVIEGLDMITVEWLLADEASGTLSTIRSTATPVRRDRDLDLCLLRVFSSVLPEDSFTLMDHADLDMKVGLAVDGTDDQFQVSPVSLLKTKTAKRATGVRAIKYWVAESPLKLGMSGGALTDDDGRLIGIASGNSDRFGYYVHIENVFDFLSVR